MPAYVERLHRKRLSQSYTQYIQHTPTALQLQCTHTHTHTQTHTNVGSHICANRRRCRAADHRQGDGVPRVHAAGQGPAGQEDGLRLRLPREPHRDAELPGRAACGAAMRLPCAHHGGRHRATAAAGAGAPGVQGRQHPAGAAAGVHRRQGLLRQAQGGQAADDIHRQGLGAGPERGGAADAARGAGLAHHPGGLQHAPAPERAGVPVGRAGAHREGVHELPHRRAAAADHADGAQGRQARHRVQRPVAARRQPGEHSGPGAPPQGRGCGGRQPEEAAVPVRVQDRGELRR